MARSLVASAASAWPGGSGRPWPTSTGQLSSAARGAGRHQLVPVELVEIVRQGSRPRRNRGVPACAARAPPQSLRARLEQPHGEYAAQGSNRDALAPTARPTCTEVPRAPTRHPVPSLRRALAREARRIGHALLPRSGASRVDHAESISSGAEDDYLSGPEAAGEWSHIAASHLGLVGKVSEEALRAVLTKQDPRTGLLLDGSVRRGRVPGSDLMFSVPRAPRFSSASSTLTFRRPTSVIVRS